MLRGPAAIVRPAVLQGSRFTASWKADQRRSSLREESPSSEHVAELCPDSAVRLSGPMMELQILQEALKVEIQVHQKLVAQMKQDPQNADLKKQLHELQAKITALSEKQKKVVEQLRKEILVKQDPETKLQVHSPAVGGDHKQSGPPLGGDNKQASLLTLTVTPVLTKTLPLVLKAAAAPTLPAAVLPQRTPAVAMVTTTISKSDSLNAPINLQVTGKPTNQISEPVRLVQATTNSSAQPIKVPQFVAPPRLTPRPSLQPQVRPKSVPCTNVPIAPAPPPMMAAPQLLQRPVMVAAKIAPSSVTPIHQLRILNGQTPPTTLTGIVITTSTRLNAAPPPSSTQPIGSPAPLPPSSTQPISSLDANTTVKLVGGREQKAVVSAPPLSPPPRQKREDNPQKLAFMVSLGLVTYDHLEEIQSRRQERKRRTTANPVYSGAVFEPERKRSAVSYLNSPLHQGTRKRGRPPKYSNVPELCSLTPTPPSSTAHPEQPSPAPPVHTLPLPSPASGDGDIHEDFCTVCRRSGQLLMCDTCSRVYHLDCLDPPLKTIPKGMWICPKCQDQILKKEEAIPWPGTLAIVHSYIAYKEAKEEEKQKLMKWSSELKMEREQLEHRVKQLSNSITKCMETKNNILARQKETQLSLEKVKHLIRLIQAFNFNQALLETEASVPTVQVPTVQVPTDPIMQVPTAEVQPLIETEAGVSTTEVPTAEAATAEVLTVECKAGSAATRCPAEARREEQEEAREASSQTHRETAEPTAGLTAAVSPVGPEKENPEVPESATVENKSGTVVASSEGAATTNGTAESVSHEASSAPRSDGKMTAASGPETAVKEEVTNSNSSKTSAPCLPPRSDPLSTLDNTK
ncbi:unnamed protein product [Merluccius merluccius]